MLLRNLFKLVQGVWSSGKGVLWKAANPCSPQGLRSIVVKAAGMSINHSSGFHRPKFTSVKLQFVPLNEVCQRIPQYHRYCTLCSLNLYAAKLGFDNKFWQRAPLVNVQVPLCIDEPACKKFSHFWSSIVKVNFHLPSTQNSWKWRAARSETLIPSSKWLLIWRKWSSPINDAASLYYYSWSTIKLTPRTIFFPHWIFYDISCTLYKDLCIRGRLNSFQKKPLILFSQPNCWHKMLHVSNTLFFSANFFPAWWLDRAASCVSYTLTFLKPVSRWPSRNAVTFHSAFISGNLNHLRTRPLPELLIASCEALWPADTPLREKFRS